MTEPELESLQAAARRAPDDLNARTAYAAALTAAGRHTAARDEMLDAAARCPASAALWWRVAFTQAAVGEAGDAHASLQRALEAGPAIAEDWARIGTLLAELQRFDEALPVLEEAARQAPGDWQVLRPLAIAEHAQARDAQALLHRAQVRSQRPDDLEAALDHALQLPLIPESEAEIVAARQRYARGLAEMLSQLPRWTRDAGQVFRIGHENFLLAYHGENDLPLQRDYARLLGTLAQAARPAWCEPRKMHWDGKRRLRVGFAGAIFYDCTAGRYFERWITGIDAARFERFVYHVGPYADAFTARLAAAAGHFAQLRPDAESLAARIEQDALDLLVYPEIGMTPVMHALAALRLAPVQLAGWGHPVTTGSGCIDGFFTAAAMEPADGAAHYVERLLPLPGLGVQYAMPPQAPPFDRADLGLAPGAVVYACPQSLFKIHPAMDALFAQLLARDPRSVLLLFQGLTRGSTERFAARLQAAFRTQGLQQRGQVKMLPRMGGEGFRRVLGACDVVLDTMRWSGGNTTLDTLAAGTPVITLPGAFMRGRQTGAMLAALGLEVLVARDVADWVQRAHELAHDPGRIALLRRQVEERRGALFDQPAPLAAFQQSLLDLAGEAAR